MARGGDRAAEDVGQLTVAALVYAGLTALAWLRPAGGRRAIGLLFAAMGVGVNGTLTVLAPEQFSELARRAPWPWYRRIGVALTQPAPRAFGVAMTVGESALAVAVLSRGRAARLGLLGVAAFCLGTAPLGTYTLANPVLAAGALHLARRSWPTAALAPRVVGEIVIDRPVDVVFDLVADQRNEPRYNPAVRDVEKLTDGPLGVGTRFRAVHETGRGPVETEAEVTAFDRPHRIASTTRTPVGEISGAVTFEGAGSATRMRWDWDVHLRGPARVLSPVVGLAGRREERACWEGLERLLETSGAPAPATA
ncbi:SRPBCC family protein [Geodermatophilus sp. SYSU D00697]